MTDAELRELAESALDNDHPFAQSAVVIPSGTALAVACSPRTVLDLLDRVECAIRGVPDNWYVLSVTGDGFIYHAILRACDGHTAVLPDRCSDGVCYGQGPTVQDAINAASDRAFELEGFS